MQRFAVTPTVSQRPSSTLGAPQSDGIVHAVSSIKARTASHVVASSLMPQYTAAASPDKLARAGVGTVNGRVQVGAPICGKQ